MQVKLSKNVPAHWTLLKERLKKICPVAGSSVPLLHTRQVQEEFRDPFLLTVDSYDRRGFLHGATGISPTCRDAVYDMI